MRKAQILNHWQSIEPDQAIKIDSVMYKHKGSTYAEDGIRLTGSPEFIDSVLSRLKDLLKHENGSTRLQLNYQESKDRVTGNLTGSYNCYVQVHERGGEAKMVNAMTGQITSRGY
jgi:hypothetical protein